MADKPWKRLERFAAATYGTTRRLMKGTDEVSDIGGDDKEFPLVLDTKLRKRESWQVIPWFKKVERAALESGKWPVLLLQEPGKVRKYVIVRRTPLVKYIMNDMPQKDLPADKFFTREVDPGRKTPILIQWNYLLKELQKEKRKRKVTVLHPMLFIKNTKADIELAILEPETLAWIFREGGLLPNVETTEDRS